MLILKNCPGTIPHSIARALSSTLPESQYYVLVSIPVMYHERCACQLSLVTSFANGSENENSDVNILVWIMFFCTPGNRGTSTSRYRRNQSSLPADLPQLNHNTTCTNHKQLECLPYLFLVACAAPGHIAYPFSPSRPPSAFDNHLLSGSHSVERFRFIQRRKSWATLKIPTMRHFS